MIADCHIISAFARGGSERLQQEFYNSCREAFGRIRGSLANVSDYDKDDIFQESFLMLWQKIERGEIVARSDGSVACVCREGIIAVPGLMSYFMGIVRNKYRENLRRNGQKADLSELGQIPELPRYSPSDADRIAAIVSECLAVMPANCVDILTKFYFHCMTLAQILKQRPGGTSYDGLKARKSKCLASLRQKVSETMAREGLAIG